MADHALIARSLARLKGRPAVDQPQRPTPATLGELLALTADSSLSPQARQRRREDLDPWNVRRTLDHRTVPCRQRRGGPLTPGDPVERYAPAQPPRDDGFAQAATWAIGATAWMRKHKIAVDESWPISLTDDLVVYEVGKSEKWLCQLSRHFNEAFKQVTGCGWMELVMLDPMDNEGGLAELACCDAYIMTYDLEGAEDANPALVLLGVIADAWGLAPPIEPSVGQFESLREACCELRLPLASAGRCLGRIAALKDKWALPAVWQSAIDGVIAWAAFTDGPWFYQGDPAECSAGQVVSFDKPLKYFEFIEQLVLGRSRLETALEPLVKQAVNKPERFWRELVRCLHDTIESHPDWSIPLKEEGPSSRLIDVLDEARTDCSCRVPVKL